MLNVVRVGDKWVMSARGRRPGWLRVNCRRGQVCISKLGVLNVGDVLEGELWLLWVLLGR
jgi:hypothetical protein